MTILYRAVKPEELIDIQGRGAFINRGFSEGKYFSTTAEGASSYAKQAYYGFGDPLYTLVTTHIPTAAITPGMCATVDRGVPVVVIPNDMLPSLTPRIEPSMPIP
jgi:hypothetical protein